MIEKLLNQKFILASKSPRRRQLMREAGFNFESISMDVDESYPDTMDPRKVPEYIAAKKAHACKVITESSQIIVAADVIVLHKNEILEKPVDREDAIRMLTQMESDEHEVISGVSIIRGETELSFSCTTHVTFGSMDANEISYYVDTFRPYDKAGSYGIQEWLGHCKVKRIEGSYTNVMGLPMFELYLNLSKLLEV